MEIIANYNFRISYIKGLENARADIFNRKSEYQENKTYKLYTIFKKDGESLIYNILQLIIIYLLKNNHLKKQIQSYYNKNTIVIYIYKIIELEFIIENDIIYFYKKVYISNQIIKEFVIE